MPPTTKTSGKTPAGPSGNKPSGPSGNKPTGFVANKPKTTKTAKPTAQARLNDMTVALREVYYDTSKWNACCLPLLGVMMFVFAIALIVIGATFNIEDLIIIGAIFIVGSFIFFFLLYVHVIRPMCIRNKVQVSYERYDNPRDDDVNQRNELPCSGSLPEYGSYLVQSDDNLEAMNRPVPTESQLYTASKSRSFLATPTTAADVTFDETTTPPPPRVHSALRRMASPPPKVALPSGEFSREKPATFDKTINDKMRNPSITSSQDLELL